jgi:lysozyme family protein
MVQSPPILSLQSPKDVSLSEIEEELRHIWQSYSTTDNNTDVPSAVRATTFTLVVYEPEETQLLLSALGYYSGPIDGIIGPRMFAAIKAAQKTYGLPRTGKADDKTKEKLREEYNERHQQEVNGNGQTRRQTYSADIEGSGIADAIRGSESLSDYRPVSDCR